MTKEQATREALELAVNAMKSFQNGTNGLYEGEFEEEIRACEEALQSNEQVEPVLVVEKEPDYMSGGHYHEGTKPRINPTKVWKLPIGTKLYTTPPVSTAQPDPYKQGYADAMNWKVQNHLEHLPPKEPELEPVAMKFKIYKPTVPDPTRQNINNALLPWVYDQDRSSGFDASMWVTPVATLTPQRKPLTDEMVYAAARAMSDDHADACNIDHDDHWKLYGDVYNDDARIMLKAAHGIKE